MSIFPGTRWWLFYQPGAFLSQDENESSQDYRIYLYHELDDMPAWDADDWESFYSFFTFGDYPDSVGFEKSIARGACAMPRHKETFRVADIRAEFAMSSPADELDVKVAGNILEFRIQGNGHDFMDDLSEFLEVRYAKISVKNVVLMSPFMIERDEIDSPGQFFSWYAKRTGLPGDLYDRWMNEAAGLGQSVIHDPAKAS